MDVSEVKKLDAYLSSCSATRISAWCRRRATSPKFSSARTIFGELTVDDEDGDRSFNFEDGHSGRQRPSFQPRRAYNVSAAPSSTMKIFGSRCGRGRPIRWKPISAKNFSVCCLRTKRAAAPTFSNCRSLTSISKAALSASTIYPAASAKPAAARRRRPPPANRPAIRAESAPSISAPSIRRSCRHMAGGRSDLAGAAERGSAPVTPDPASGPRLVGRAVRERLMLSPSARRSARLGVARIDQLERSAGASVVSLVAIVTNIRSMMARSRLGQARAFRSGGLERRPEKRDRAALRAGAALHLNRIAPAAR